MSKPRRSGRKHTTKSLADVTINDFANSSVCSNRLKKSTNNVKKVLKTLEDDKSWEEKLDEEGEFVQQVNDDGTVTYVVQKLENRRRKKTSTSSSEMEGNGNEYPIDIWYLISEHIRPEDVGRFAGICRASLEVVSGAKFWFSLYRRYYKSVPKLPEKLQPEYLQRRYSLRTSVIRALHFMYPPFREKCFTYTGIDDHPGMLKKRQCILMWHQKKTPQWVYYFKLKESTFNLPPQYRKSEPTSRPDLLEILDDVTANPEDKCCVLQITCNNFIPVPPVLGLTLSSVSMTLSKGFMHHRLTMVFGSGVLRSSTTYGSNNTMIILDPVINVRVLNWWHPLYPHTSSLEQVLNKDGE